MASANAPRSVRPANAAGTIHLWFRAGEVVQIVGVSRRQLQYWAQTDLIRPSAKTPGGHGRYTFEDLVALKAAKRLIDAGVPVQRIRKSIQALLAILPTVRRPLAELVLVATGDVVIAFRDGMAFDAISGQEWVFEVAELQREVEDWQRSGSARPASLVGERNCETRDRSG
jgi:DNA-binding transcriptional MerR regulator